MAQHDETPTPRETVGADEARAFRAVWDRNSSEDSTGSYWVAAPNFPVVRRGYRREQVKEYVTQVSRRIRGLEMQLEDDREELDRLRSLPEQAGDPDGLMARVAALQDELDRTRAALDDASKDPEREADHTARVEKLESELEGARRELAETREQLALTTTRLDGVLRQEGGADPYGAIASQIADLIRAAGVQAEEIRREAAQEVERVLSQARMDAGDMVREAQVEADAFKQRTNAEADRLASEREETLRRAREEADALIRDAQELADRVGADRDQILGRARDQASKMLSTAEAESARKLEEAERELARARTESERMLGAGISRRDLVRAEMLALRERLGGAMALLDMGAESESRPTQATLDLEQDVVDVSDGEDASDESVA
jgi:cell division septum initiation protein DivIVA